MRFDIFINGQYILEKDYIREQVGTELHIKFKKASILVITYKHLMI